MNTVQYVNDMIALHKSYAVIRRRILEGVVNSEYGRVSNHDVDAIWIELNRRFPS